MSRWHRDHPNYLETGAEPPDYRAEADNRRKAQREGCQTCGGQGVVPIAGPDENGQYDTDDCPDCACVPGGADA